MNSQGNEEKGEGQGKSLEWGSEAITLKILESRAALLSRFSSLVKALKMAQRAMKKTIGESAKDISETCLSAEAHAMTVDGLEAVAAALSQVKGGASK